MTAQTLADLSPGSIIGDRYEIVRHLGVGGFATVFVGFDKEIEREVAIKILNMTTVSGDDQEVDLFLERFRREAKLAARIRHPNVVEIYDFGIFGRHSNPYIVMEMLSGHDLEEELCNAGGMDPERALPLFCDALDALGEAHRLGIVHKDLKPANLFINNPDSRREVLKLVDFGIAHMGESDEGRMTQTGAMFGTPQYLSPEYVQSQIVTPGMDVYQMGLILVEMLTGLEVVSETNPWQCAVKHVSRDINLPVQLLDGPLGPVVRRALEYEVADRFPTASEFADALAAVDPATVGDLSAPGMPVRRIDNTSGQFVPADQQSVHLGLQHTDKMTGNELRHTGQMAARASNSATLIDEGRPDIAGPEIKDTFGINAPNKRKKRLGILAILALCILLAGGALIAILGSQDSSTSATRAEQNRSDSAAVAPSEIESEREEAEEAALAAERVREAEQALKDSAEVVAGALESAQVEAKEAPAEPPPAAAKSAPRPKAKPAPPKPAAAKPAKKPAREESEQAKPEPEEKKPVWQIAPDLDDSKPDSDKQQMKLAN